jgi:hypothetical protein
MRRLGVAIEVSGPAKRIALKNAAGTGEKIQKML